MEKRIPDGEAAVIEYGETTTRCNVKYATILSLNSSEVAGP